MKKRKGALEGKESVVFFKSERLLCKVGWPARMRECHVLVLKTMLTCSIWRPDYRGAKAPSCKNKLILLE